MTEQQVSAEEILARINEIIGSYGCEATELGPDAVGQQGDNRVYGPSVYVTFKPGMSMEEIAFVSNEITNKTPSHFKLTRVLMNVVPC